MPADAVAVCECTGSAAQGRSLIAVSTYLLEDGVKRGSFFVLEPRAAADGEGLSARRLCHSVETAAVFDVRWDRRRDPRMLAAATSGGCVELYDAATLTMEQSSPVTPAAIYPVTGEASSDAGACPSALMVHWLAGSHSSSDSTGGSRLSVSRSDGFISIIDAAAPAAPAVTHQWKAHWYAGMGPPSSAPGSEVWCLWHDGSDDSAAAPSDSDHGAGAVGLLWTGADNGELKGWDLR